MRHDSIYQSISEIIGRSRQRVYRMVNAALLEPHWRIGEILVKDEQHGKSKADYGKAILKTLDS